MQRALGRLAAVAASLLFASAAMAETRLALIIANQNYAEAVGPLANPHNDGRRIAAALEQHGFRVRLVTEQSTDDMRFEITAFAGRLAEHGRDAVGFFYYVGHGVAEPVTGRNHLIPPDVSSFDDPRIWSRALRLSWVRDELRALAPQARHVVVFDACREELRLPGTRGRMGGRGLSLEAPLGGMLTAFSASATELALDAAPGGGDLGPYAQALADELDAAAGAHVELVFSAVRRRFRRLGLAQRPTYTNELDGEVLFGEPGGGEERPLGAPPPDSLEQETAAEIETTVSPLDGAIVHLTASPERLAPLSVFRECPGCPEMIVLPGGAFLMGSPETERGRRDNEGPQTSVTVRRFAIARTETTLAAFALFAQETRYGDGASCWTFENDRGGTAFDGATWTWADRRGRSRRAPGFRQEPTEPVVCVSADGASAYGAWIAARSGGAGYRLPSEAEWEYAARGGSRAAYSFGADPAALGAYGWHLGVSGFRTRPVARLRPNSFGLFDMHGNVWEWTADCASERIDLRVRDGSASTAGDCGSAMFRGGSWINEPSILRSALRNAARRDYRNSGVGFRLARTLTP